VKTFAVNTVSTSYLHTECQCVLSVQSDKHLVVIAEMNISDACNPLFTQTLQRLGTLPSWERETRLDKRQWQQPTHKTARWVVSVSAC